MLMRSEARAALHKTESAHQNGWWDAHPGATGTQGLIAAIGGSATAVGDSTATTGLIENFAQDKGNVSIAMGEALFQASAQSANTGGVLAAATTFLDALGADIIFEYQGGQSVEGQQASSAASELEYLALDFHGWSPPRGPIVIQMQQPFGQSDQPLGLEASHGNFAQVLATSEAHGANALSATFTSAVAIENHFSFVNAVGIVAV